jgi:xylan 1,4-beta-xylosidase
LGMNSSGSTELQLRKVKGGTMDLSRKVTFKKKEVALKIEARGGEYDFYYSTNNGTDWEAFYTGLDGTVLSTETAGGFVGTVIGMYAFSSTPQ